ncbi:DNA polymerase Y family protein [Donghicola sp. C2-DW-16]|uniref:DNA-directed DNA polymerase n=1 Tax=Donghicola mangrovi TaxID=2729614 RepID=A0ABX2PGR4_9RHOB|nr:DNA polymerase Y family protein [Donghicola mangrovi]NVO28675.1 DNA polymerase Y family protein [Donghicola mangrovi]
MVLRSRERHIALWLNRLPSDRILRLCPTKAPFVIAFKKNNTNLIYCRNQQAENADIRLGMTLGNAQSFCPGLLSAPADPVSDARFLETIRRWALRYCPTVAIDGHDGLTLDITGAAHLWGGETQMLGDIRKHLRRAGLSVKCSVAGTRAAAWALAHYGEGWPEADIPNLPIEALRIDPDLAVTLRRIGIRTIADLAVKPRAPVANRFGTHLLCRLDQVLGHMPEPVHHEPEPAHYGMRLSLPEPIGTDDDVMQGIERLLQPLCDKLKANEAGARVLLLTIRRVDMDSQQIELRLAAPMRDPARILPLFKKGVEEVDAGYGIDQLRLEATQVLHLPVHQPGFDAASTEGEMLPLLVTSLGTRLDLENVLRFLPADSHVPERAFSVAPFAFSQPDAAWSDLLPRPVNLFPPEPAFADTPALPDSFRWRGMRLSPQWAEGPERIAPEWWFEDQNWRTGVRDYWRVQTRQGPRLWMFYTPQSPGWYIEGEFA